MAIELYWVSGSPFSWRVLLALELKGLPYQSHLLEMSKRQHKTPEFLAMNPRGEVPVLRDGPVTVSESIAILAYLDRQYPEPPLFGRTPIEAAAIWQEVIQAALHVDRFEEFILPMYFGQAAAREAEVKKAIPHIRAELDRLERTLTARAWLAGPAVSAADLTVYPAVRSLMRAAEKPEAAPFDHGFLPLAATWPGVVRWMSAVEALPGYDRTFPPHWRR
jgi:glutathione S-transferase